MLGSRSRDMNMAWDMANSMSLQHAFKGICLATVESCLSSKRKYANSVERWYPCRGNGSGSEGQTAFLCGSPICEEEKGTETEHGLSPLLVQSQKYAHEA